MIDRMRKLIHLNFYGRELLTFKLDERKRNVIKTSYKRKSISKIYSFWGYRISAMIEMLSRGCCIMYLKMGGWGPIWAIYLCMLFCLWTSTTCCLWRNMRMGSNLSHLDMYVALLVNIHYLLLVNIHYLRLEREREREG